MTTHKIKKGFDLPLAGRPEQVLTDAAEPAHVALETFEFAGIKPKVLVKEGDAVETGQPVYLNKVDRDIVWCAPASGTVKAIEFGPRRFLTRVVIEVGADQAHADLPKLPQGGSRADVVKAIKGAGLWPMFKQRPLGKMPVGDAAPVAIFVNGMDTAPLAGDPCFAVQGRTEDLQAGVEVLKQLTDGAVYLTLRAGGAHQDGVRGLSGVDVHEFSGPHPSGLVGTHIHESQPLKGAETAFALSLVDLARLGEWARTGGYPAHTVVAVCGSEAPNKQYFRVRQGASLSVLTGGAALTGDVRCINGDVLHGYVADPDGYLAFGNRTLTVMQEGTDRRDMFGWAIPQFGKKLSNHAAVNFGLKKREYTPDARLHGGHRPIVNIGSWEKVMPLDILPTFLVRAIQAKDIEEAVKLGLLEVTEEDVALCTFVDPCKIDVGEVVRQGLDMYEEES
ncbi:MAG: NADH:ubiquinone reductase (Na(+)-transporting) subunit A [Planctomycetota bacterium]|nr:NADH:ubiquinone reductase (Na(+)-transporting) subunit A [Planctomycetota bacterium]